MATAKFTAAMGSTVATVTKGSGATISGGNAVEVNVDFTKITSSDFASILEDIKAKALTGGWPPA